MSIYWTVFENTPASQAEVRSNSPVVPNDMAPAEVPAEDIPEYNEVFTDDNTALGMTTRGVKGHTYPSEPVGTPFWSEGASHDYNANDERQSTVGHAAELEAQGKWGHGTMEYTDSLERLPDFRYGNDYFAAETRGANSPSRATYGVSAPTNYDGDVRAAVNATAAQNAKETNSQVNYGQWWSELGFTNG